MVGKLISKGKKLLTGPQSSILSAASIIMIMVVASRILGLVRQRTIAHYFTPDEISLFFAAFRLPDTIFEVLVFGTFSSAFIPVFSKLVDKDTKEAWRLASVISNLGLIVFMVLAITLIMFADNIYGIIAPGYESAARDQIVQLTKVLFAAQGFFVLSYVLTGVLESLRRFLIPALAPLFYNLGIIFGTIFLSKDLGLLAPTVGVFVGALLHFLIQLPLAVKLGYRVTSSLKIDSSVKKIGRLAAPRVLELTFLQIVKSVELYLSSFISTAAYAYYSLGNTIQLVPVGIFGTSIAKAALPTLSKQSDNPIEFKKSLWSSFYQIVFLVSPIASILIVLRVPIVRLIYGTEIFDWGSTVQTGMVVSAFAVGVVFQASASLLARSFYALHDTKTPVITSIISMIMMIILNFTLVRILGLPVWGLAVAFSLGNGFQAIALFILINKRLGYESFSKLITPLVKIFAASALSSSVMFFLIKFFDRSVWVKRLSFLSKIDTVNNLPFEKFVLDTRYTVNLLILTIVVSLVGVVVYIAVSMLLKSQEVWVFFRLIKRIFIKGKISPIPEEREPVVPTPTESTQ